MFKITLFSFGEYSRTIPAFYAVYRHHQWREGFWEMKPVVFSMLN